MSSRTISESYDMYSPTMKPRSFQAFSFDRYIPFRPNLNVDYAHLKVISTNKGNSNHNVKRIQSTPCLGQTDSENYRLYLNAALKNNDGENVLPLTDRNSNKARRSSLSTPPWQIDMDEVFFTSAPKARKRKMVNSPSRVLDMPGLREDLYTNILDWNCNNYLAVSLKQTVYIWSAERGTCRRIRVNFSEYERAFLTALSWNQSGKFLAVGTNGGEVLLADDKCLTEKDPLLDGVPGVVQVSNKSEEIRQPKLLDAERTKLLISFRSSEKSHISALDWNEKAFCSGSVAGNICLHDERQPTEHVTYIGRHRSMFSLKFSLHNYLASGGSDGIVNIWDIRKLAKCNKIEAHGITKALSWCPWRSNVIATGGYDEDGSIKIWHAPTAKLLSQTKVNSKVCSMIWSPEYKELVTGLAGPNMKNQIAIWKDQSLDTLDLVGALCQHDGQPLHLALSPTGTILASAGSDEIMCLWNCFPPTRKGSDGDIFSPLSLLKTVR